MKSFLMIVMMFALVSIGCGPGDKSAELRELERLLQAPDATEVRDAPGASKAYRESRQFRRFSLEAWEEGKSELSIEYAILGTLRFRTAQAIASQMVEKERLDTANSRIGTSNPELKVLNDERLKLTTEVANLERQVGLARTTHQAKQQQAHVGQTQTSTSDAARRSQIIEKLREVQNAQRAAETVDAGTHAPEKYNRALNMVKSTQSLLDSGQSTDQMLSQLVEAQNLFTQAQTEAQAGFKEAQARANPEQRRTELRAEARSALGAENVLTEGNGTRVVLGALFDTGSSTLSTGAEMRIQSVAKLAQKYEEFTLFIEGYTSKTGSATENLGLSQLRAVAVRNALTRAGVETSRIDTRGFGQDRLRFGDNERNERVEIVLSRPN